MNPLRQAVAAIVRLQEATDMQHLAATAPSRVAARKLAAGDPQFVQDAQIIRSRTAMICGLRSHVIDMTEWEQDFVMDLTINANTTDESGRRGGGLVTLNARQVADLTKMASVYLRAKAVVQETTEAKGDPRAPEPEMKG